jgi:hypothetical protein
MTKSQGKLKLQESPKEYPLDFEKVKNASVQELAYLVDIIAYAEEYEYFDKIKHLLVIPEQPKSLEEIQQELDEKFEKLLVQTRRKFDVSKQTAEYNFDKKFDKINENFEYIKEWGRLPYITLDPTVLPQMNGAYLVSTGSAQQWTTEFRFGKGNVGYYCIEPDVKFHMSKKPNFIVRFFMDKCLGFKWISAK